MTLSLLVFLATAKAFKYKRDSLQKNLRNKLENKLSVSEPLKDSHKGFNAGDLQNEKKRKNKKKFRENIHVTTLDDSTTSVVT